MFQDYVVQAPPLRIGAPPWFNDDGGIREERAVAAALRRQQERRELQALLGSPLYARTTILPVLGGGQLGPARDRLGRDLRWGLWSPHRKVLVDIFPRTLPTFEELEDRHAWATAQGLRYALVRPGMRLTIETLRALVEEGGQASV